MDDALNGCEPDSGSFELLSPVETLENSEQFVDILHVKADAVVFDKDYHSIAAFVRGPDFNLWLRPRSGELDGVRDQIDEHELEHRSVAIQIGQRADFP